MSSFRPLHRQLLRDPAGEAIDPPSPPSPPGDELDRLLRQWHHDNAERAAAGRDRLLASLRETRQVSPAAPSVVVRRFNFARFAPLAAAAVIALAVIPLLLISNKTAPVAVAKADSNVILAPDGGRLDAYDARGDLLGPCVLKHTDVQATVSGPYVRVTLTQKYHNSLADKIEAVYTFPLSHRAAVDRMTMTIGDRVIIGEVKERSRAREVYEAARESGRVASLLEQERPNIFTQSVANIEPGADIDITISYVEQLESRGGDYEFTFPTVVGPRYIPGGTAADAENSGLSASASLQGFDPREGVNLLAPARLSFARNVENFDPQVLAAALPQARPLAPAAGVAEPAASLGAPVVEFEATYPDGSREPGRLYANDVGEVGGRWFFMPEPKPGAAFAGPTAEVPDADRITPMPLRPETRAGHDISISVIIDTGGPGLVDIESPLHSITRQDVRLRPDGMPSRSTVTLAGRATIPNRDFVLKWRQAAPGVIDSVFTARAEQGDFFAVMLQPPNRVEDAAAVPRELVFVLDTSGSMRGKPIEASKAVARSLIGSMRPQDTFNVVTFSGDTRVLWPEPRPVTDANRETALAFFDRREGAGGTEMMTAIQTALRPATAEADAGAITPIELAALPADGREVTVRIDDGDLDSSGLTTESILTEGRLILNHEAQPPVTARIEQAKLQRTYLRRAAEHLGDDTRLTLLVRGRWVTEPGTDPARALIAESTILADEPPVRPLRIVVFLTDGYVGNDHAIIDAIQQNRGTTRVFSLGIGNSVNRYLLDGMARAGGGEADYVLIPREGTPDGEFDQALAREMTDVTDRLNRRTHTPVLTHITAEFSPGLDVADIEPPLDHLPDLFEARPISLLGRLARPGQGFVTIRGQTAAGPWERTIPIRLDEQAAGRAVAAELGQSVVPDLWARARIDHLLGDHMTALQLGETPATVRSEVIQLGESFGIMSPFTSFVAVDHQRITIDGQPTLVPIPIELPDSTSWDGFFGPDAPERAAAEVLQRQMESKKDMEARTTPRSGLPMLSVSRRPAPAGKSEGAVSRGGSTAPAETTPPPPPMPAATGSVVVSSPPPGARPAMPAAAAEPTRKQAEGSEKPKGRASGRARENAEVPGATAEREVVVGASTHRGLRDGLKEVSPDEDLDQVRAVLRTDPSVQNLAAETFYKRIEDQINLTESLGQTPPDRLAIAAGTNFIAQNIVQGQLAAANRAQELFQNRYPDAPLLNESARLVAANSLAQQPVDAAIGTSTADKDTAKKPELAAQSKQAPEPPAPSLTGEADALAARAQQAAERERTLLRRLDQRLYDLLPSPSVNSATNTWKPTAQTNSRSLAFRQAQPRGGNADRLDNRLEEQGDAIIVSVLVEAIDEPTLAALKSVGFRVDKRLDGSLTVVGSIPIGRLEALALLPGVRRIEPATTLDANDSAGDARGLNSR